MRRASGPVLMSRAEVVMVPTLSQLQTPGGRTVTQGRWSWFLRSANYRLQMDVQSLRVGGCTVTQARVGGHGFSGPLGTYSCFDTAGNCPQTLADSHCVN